MAARDDLLSGLLSRPHLEAVEKERAQRFRERMLERRAGRLAEPRKLRPPRRRRPKPGLSIVVIGDAHAHPDFLQHNVRFEWLGRAVAEWEPDVVVDIGDWWDMPSLWGFESKGAPRELGRYWRDIEAGVDARERFEWALAQAKRKEYETPRLESITGNHEERITRAQEAVPALREAWGYHDFGDELFGWNRTPFGEPLDIGGVQFIHTPFKRAGAYGGPRHLAFNAMCGQSTKLKGQSSVHGHSHRVDLFQMGPNWMSLCVGYYVNYVMEWLPEAEQQDWQPGLVRLNDVRDSRFDFEFVGIEEVERRFG